MSVLDTKINSINGMYFGIIKIVYKSVCSEEVPYNQKKIQLVLDWDIHTNVTVYSRVILLNVKYSDQYSITLTEVLGT